MTLAEAVRARADCLRPTNWGWSPGALRHWRI